MTVPTDTIIPSYAPLTFTVSYGPLKRRRRRTVTWIMMYVQILRRPTSSNGEKFVVQFCVQENEFRPPIELSWKSFCNVYRLASAAIGGSWTISWALKCVVPTASGLRFWDFIQNTDTSRTRYGPFRVLESDGRLVCFIVFVFTIQPHPIHTRSVSPLRCTRAV